MQTDLSPAQRAVADASLVGHWWTVDRAESDRAVLTILDGIGCYGPDITALATELDGCRDIHLVIDSTGGDSKTALLLFDVLRWRVADVTIHTALSAAAILAMVGPRRRAHAPGRMMIHAPRQLSLITAFDLEAAGQSLAHAADQFQTILCAATGQPADIVNRWLQADTWFTPESAEAYGLIHEIISEAPPRAVPKAPAPAPATARPPMSLDERFVLQMLEAYGPVETTDRRRFLRNLTALMHQNLKPQTTE